MNNVVSYKGCENAYVLSDAFHVVLLVLFLHNFSGIRRSSTSHNKAIRVAIINHCSTDFPPERCLICSSSGLELLLKMSILSVDMDLMADNISFEPLNCIKDSSRGKLKDIATSLDPSVRM